MVKIDNKLVYLYSENPRLTLKEMSRHIGKSPQRLKYNLSGLLEQGILKNPHCIIDYSYFGLLLFRVYFRGTYAGEKDKKKLIDELKRNDDIISINELSGEFDLAVEFLARNPSKFNKQFKKLITQIPRLNDYKLVLNLVSRICPARYLVKSEILQRLNQEMIVGGDREEENFNYNEKKAITTLLNNPTAHLVELAQKTGLNIKTAKNTLETLRKRNIIKGFKYQLDTNKLGTHKNRLFLKVRNLSVEKEAHLTAHLINTKEVIRINKTLGDWDIEVDIESLERNKAKSIVLSLREDFTEILERFNIIEMYDCHKMSYLPNNFFTEN